MQAKHSSNLAKNLDVLVPQRRHWIMKYCSSAGIKEIKIQPTLTANMSVGLMLSDKAKVVAANKTVKRAAIRGIK